MISKHVKGKYHIGLIVKSKQKWTLETIFTESFKNRELNLIAKNINPKETVNVLVIKPRKNIFESCSVNILAIHVDFEKTLKTIFPTKTVVSSAKSSLFFIDGSLTTCFIQIASAGNITLLTWPVLSNKKLFTWKISYGSDQSSQHQKRITLSDLKRFLLLNSQSTLKNSMKKATVRDNLPIGMLKDSIYCMSTHVHR